MSLRILVNNSYLEVDADELVVPFTYSVADMKQPDKRKTSSSKTIKLYGTQRNLNILRNVYSLPFATFEDNPVNFVFDPRTRIEAQYEEDGILVFDGLFQVLKAIRNGEQYEFECLLFANIANVIQKLGDLRLTDLNWSEYQHVLGKQVIRDSWSASVVQNGSPVTNFTSGVPDGFGYIYGWFDMGLEYPSVHPRFQRTNQIPLGVYFKEILQKTMAAIEQPYSFTLDNTELWKRLTLFNGGGEIAQITEEDKDLREVQAEYNADTFVFNQQYQNNQENTSTILKPWLLSSAPVDLLNQTNGTDIEIAFSGNYQFTWTGNVNYSIVTIGNGVFSVAVEILVNGSLNQTIYESGNISGNGILLGWNETRQMNLNIGDVITQRLRFVFDYNNPPVLLNPNFIVNILAASYTTNMLSLDSEIEDNTTVDVVRWLPNIKLADFYKSIMRMFNLYQVDQPDGSVFITPASNFYLGTNSNETEDWSDKLDYSQVIEIEPPNRIEGKNYVFKYTEEQDVYHNAYRNEFGANYGDFTYTVPNTWQIGDNVLQVGFSLGVPALVEGSDVVMPTIFQWDNGLKRPYKGKAPRIYVYNGLRNSTSQNRIEVSDPDVSDSLIIYSTGTQNAYPAFHHQLNPVSPTQDIVFGVPQRLYYSGGQITNNTLYLQYWDRFVRELTSEDSKILTAYFKLSALDIHNLNFRVLKNIDGVVYRLNMVSDYMGQELTTKCELIKVIEGQSRRIRTTGQPILTNVFNPNGGALILEPISGVAPKLELGQFGLNIPDATLYIGVGQGRTIKFEA